MHTCRGAVLCCGCVLLVHASLLNVAVRVGFVRGDGTSTSTRHECDHKKHVKHAGQAKGMHCSCE